MQGIGLSCIHISNHIQRQRIKIEIKRVEKKLAGSILMAIVSVIFIASCACKHTCTSGKKSVEYTIAHNYFFNNDARIPTDPKVTDSKTFNKLYGMAATMGKNGIPTNIDFNKQFVIGVVLPITNKQTKIIPGKLVKRNNELEFTYKIKRGSTMSSSMQPMLLIVVDRKYETDKVRVVEG